MASLEFFTRSKLITSVNIGIDTVRRFKTSLAFSVALALPLGASTLFAQTETSTPVSPQVETPTQPTESSVVVEPAETQPGLNNTDVKRSGITSADDSPNAQKPAVGSEAAPADTAEQPEKPKAAPVQTTEPVAANTPPGRFALTFDDLKFDMEKTEAFDRKMLSSKINGYHGGKVKIRGYIRPNFKQSGITKFIFVRDNKECCFGPQAAIFDNILVRLERGSSTNYTVRPVTIEGDFVLKEYHGDDGNVWSLYRMYNAKLK